MGIWKDEDLFDENGNRETCIFLKGWVVIMLDNRRYNKGTSTMESLIATIVILLIIFGVVALFMPDNPKCIEPGCDRNQAENQYC